MFVYIFLVMQNVITCYLEIMKNCMQIGFLKQVVYTRACLLT